MHVVYDFTKKYQDACKVGRIVKLEKELTWDDFLAALPENEKQHWRCHTCKQWFEQFGSLVVVNEEIVEPVFWVADETTPVDLVVVFDHLRGLVKKYVAEEGKLVPFTTETAFLRKANKTGVVGVPARGGFTHFHFREEGNKLNRQGKNQVNAKYETVRSRLVTTLKYPEVIGRIEAVLTHLEMSPFAKAKKDAETVRNWFLDPIKRIKAGASLTSVLLSLSDDQVGYLESFASSAVSAPVLGYASDGLNLELECDKYFEYIDPENFRKTKREASEQAVKSLVEKIREEGTDPALTLRFAKMDEIKVLFPIARCEVTEEEQDQASTRSLLSSAEELLEERGKRKPFTHFWSHAPGQKEFDGKGERIGLRTFLELVKKHNSPVNVWLPHSLLAGAWVTHDTCGKEHYPWRWDLQEEPAAFSWIRQVAVNYFGVSMGWAGLVGITQDRFCGDKKLQKDLNDGRIQLVFDGDASYKRPIETDFASPSPYLTEYLNQDYYEHNRALNELGHKTPMTYNGEPWFISFRPNGSTFMARIKVGEMVYYYEVFYADLVELESLNASA